MSVPTEPGWYWAAYTARGGHEWRCMLLERDDYDGAWTDATNGDLDLVIFDDYEWGPRIPEPDDLKRAVQLLDEERREGKRQTALWPNLRVGAAQPNEPQFRGGGESPPVTRETIKGG